jgi:hypothetical protein
LHSIAICFCSFLVVLRVLQRNKKVLQTVVVLLLVNPNALPVTLHLREAAETIPLCVRRSGGGEIVPAAPPEQIKALRAELFEERRELVDSQRLQLAYGRSRGNWERRLWCGIRDESSALGDEQFDWVAVEDVWVDEINDRHRAPQNEVSRLTTLLSKVTSVRSM